MLAGSTAQRADPELRQLGHSLHRAAAWQLPCHLARCIPRYAGGREQSRLTDGILYSLGLCQNHTSSSPLPPTYSNLQQSCQNSAFSPLPEGPRPQGPPHRPLGTRLSCRLPGIPTPKAALHPAPPQIRRARAATQERLAGQISLQDSPTHKDKPWVIKKKRKPIIRSWRISLPASVLFIYYAV